MRKKSKNVHLIAIAILFVFLLSNFLLFISGTAAGPVFDPLEQATAEKNQPEETFLLVVINKPVFVQLPHLPNSIEVTSQTPVPAGTVIHTGSGGRAEIRYPNKSITRINHNTQLQLQEVSLHPQTSKLKLLKGTIWNRIAALFGKEAFKTESAGMVATVRGTAYQMEVNEEGTNSILVEEGTVGVVAEKEELIVEQNRKLSFIPNKEQAPVIEEYYPDTTTEWYRFNAEQDQKWMQEHKKEYRKTLEATPTPLPVPYVPEYIPPAIPHYFHVPYLSPTLVLEKCVGPDNKVFKATKKDCKSLNDFWNSVNPK